MFVYDITNYSSFENLDDWLTIVQQECFKGDAKPPHLALVANKSEPYDKYISDDVYECLKCTAVDLEHMRTVRKEKHTKFAQEHHMSRYTHKPHIAMYLPIILSSAVTLFRPRLMTR